MNLQHLEIHNFRCFADLDLPVGGSSLAIVAPNAGGKSSLIAAVAWALGGPRGVALQDLADPEDQMYIIATVGGIRREDHGKFVEGALRFTGAPTVRIGVRAIWDEHSGQLDVDWGFPDAGWRRAGRDVRDALPVLFLPTDRDTGRLTQFAGGRSVLATLLEAVGAVAEAEGAAAGVAKAAKDLAAGPALTKLLHDIGAQLAALIPRVGTYGVNPAELSVEQLLRLLDLQLAYEGPAIPVARQSSGLGQLTVAALAVQLLKKRPETLLLVDEPELSLHPHAQRAVLAALESTEAQIVLATHSASVLAEIDVRSIAVLRRANGTVTAARPANINDDEAKRLRRFATPLTNEAFFARQVVFVEGITDYQAVRAIAVTLGRNLDAEGIAVVALDGAASLTTFLQIMGPAGLDLKIGGICDADYEADWCTYLSDAGIPVSSRADLKARGFYVSDRDLEDELITALGTADTQAVFDGAGATATLGRYVGQPANQGMSLHDQLRGFAKTKKATWTPRLAEAVTATNVPASIKDLLDNV
jgi:energy-coupling factor transporter ATP-binding protein EcfA2